MRFCIDYRRLNDVTKKDSYPLPRMDECIDSLGHAKVFSALDANWEYWQVPIWPSDIPKTDFTSHLGLYEYTRMPFGLTNAPATFQRALYIILSKYNWQTCLVYLDDIIVFSKSHKEHIDHLDQILTALKSAGVTLKLRKCSFFTDRIKYLGHIIRPGTLEVERLATASLRDLRQPETFTELRSFLGLCNVYRRFIRNFSDLAATLFALLKGKPVPKDFPGFDVAQAKTYKQLIKAVTNPPVLALPRLGLPYSIDTDACMHQIGCALFQLYEDNVRRPIGFWSRTLTKAEQNYSTPEQECLAVVYAIQICRPYLQGELFTIYTDCSALRWLFEINDLSGRLMRWRLRLAEFRFKTEYRKEIKNCQGDAMYRLRSLSKTVVAIDEEIPSYPAAINSDIEFVNDWHEDKFDPRMSSTTGPDAFPPACNGWSSGRQENVRHHTQNILLAERGARLLRICSPVPRLCP